jgi:deazaflavin-dependent oxidoreductase (nitroreductase family)
MTIPKSVARFNRAATNRVTGPFASHAPGFAVVVHRGRRSGRSYRTPINVFRAPGGFVAALAYGADADWVRNVIAADGCELDVRGERVRVTSPRIVHDQSRRAMPPGVRQFLRLVGVTDFLYLTSERTPPAP